MRSSYSGRVIEPKISTCTLPRMFMPAPWITRTLGITLSFGSGYCCMFIGAQATQVTQRPRRQNRRGRARHPAHRYGDCGSAVGAASRARARADGDRGALRSRHRGRDGGGRTAVPRVPDLRGRWPTACPEVQRPSGWRGHFHLRPLSPVRHVHVAIHGHCGGDVFAGLITLARACEELAEVEMAVGYERAHAELLGQGERLPIARARTRMPRPSRGKFCEDTQGVCLVPSATSLAGEIERTLCLFLGLFEVVLEAEDLAPPDTE